MKGTYSKTVILGNIGQDPEVKATGSGTTVANISIATTEPGAKQADGRRTENTEWHRCVAFGKTAEFIQQYVRKGAKVMVEGKNQTRKWQDGTGSDRWTTEVVIANIELVGSAPSANGQNTQNAQQGSNQPQNNAQAPRSQGNAPQGNRQTPPVQQQQQQHQHQTMPQFDDFETDHPC